MIVQQLCHTIATSYVIFLTKFRLTLRKWTQALCQIFLFLEVLLKDFQVINSSNFILIQNWHKLS